jgi:hypothetical protein
MSVRQTNHERELALRKDETPRAPCYLFAIIIGIPDGREVTRSCAFCCSSKGVSVEQLTTNGRTEETCH